MPKAAPAKKGGKKAKSEDDESDFEAEGESSEGGGDESEDSEASEVKKPSAKKQTKKAGAGKAKSSEPLVETKKRMPDGKPKKVPAPKGAAAATGKAGAGKVGAGPGGKEKPKEEKKMMSEKEAKEAIREYMIKQNRPYSYGNIIDNLHGRIAKSICLKVLEELTNKEKVLTAKEYGKCIIYLANQDKFPATSNSELAKLDDQIKSIKDGLEERKTRLKDAQGQLQRATQGLNNTQLRAELERLKKQNADMGVKLEKYEAGAVKLVSEDDIEKGKKEMVRQCQEWRKRKRACMEIVDMISESADLNKKEFIKKLGLETDEEARVNI